LPSCSLKIGDRPLTSGTESKGFSNPTRPPRHPLASSTSASLSADSATSPPPAARQRSPSPGAKAAKAPWGIPNTTRNAASAAAFISYATQGEGIDLWADGLGFVPAAANWKLNSTVLAGDPAAEQGYQQIQQLINKPSSDRNNMSSFSAQVGKYVLEVAQGRMSAQAAAAKGQKDLDSGLYT
jgi:ABC-type glycerol-3-phosphate transport system substrate-binding protein